MTTYPQERRATTSGKRRLILASSIAALLNAGFFLTAAHGDLIVDSATFNENLPNSYSGNTFVRSTSSTGTLNLNVANALPGGTRSAVTMDDGTSQGGSIINLNGFSQVAASLTSPNSGIGSSSVINLNGNTLVVGNNLGGPATTFYGAIQAGGSLTKDGSSEQILAGINTYNGSTTVSAGDLEIGTAATAGAISSSSAVSIATGGTLTLVKITGNTFSNNVTNDVGGTGTLNINSASTNTLFGALTDVLTPGDSGQLALTQSGTGTTILANTSNTFTGATTITGGILQVGTVSFGSSLGTSAVSVGNGGTLRLTDVIIFVTDPDTGEQKQESIFTNDITNGLTGVGTVNVNSNYTTTLSGTLSDGATMANPNVKLGLTQSGTGTTILTGNNTYTGTTTINKGTLQIGDGVATDTALASAVQVNATGTLTIDLSNGLGFSSAVTLNAGNATLNAIQSGTNTLSGVISGNGVVKQTGTGTTILTGANTYTGLTTVAAGTLQIGNGNTALTSIASSGKVKVNSGATLAIDMTPGSIFANAVGLGAADAALDAVQSGTNTLSGIISGSGVLNQEGSGTTILTALETYTGATTVTAGTLQIGSISTVGKIATGSAISVGSGGTLSVVNINGDKLTNPVTNGVGGFGTVNANSANTTTFSGALTDGAGQLLLTQSGTGTTILTNANNSYTGATAVTNGTLQIGTTSVAGSIGVTGGATVSNDATLKLIKIVGNELDTNISNGTAGMGALNIGTLDIASAVTNTIDGALTDGLAGQLALTQNGTGTTILANANNSYSGATTVSSGVLEIGTTDVAGSIGAASAVSVSNGGILRLINVNGNVIGGITNGVVGVGKVNTDSANTITVTGALTDGMAGTLQLTQSGTGTTVLANAGNTYSGPTLISKGVLQIGSKTSPGSIGANSAVSVTNTGTLTLFNVNGNSFGNPVTDSAHVVASGSGSADNYTIGGVISGSGDFKKLSANTVTVTAANTYHGSTLVSAGTLVVNNATGSGTGSGTVTVGGNGTLGGSGTISGGMTMASGGVIAPGVGTPGTPGTKLHAGSLLWNGGGELDFQIGSTSTADELILGGALTKGSAGTFVVDITGTGTAGGIYTLATFASTNFAPQNFKLELPAGDVGTLVKTSTSLTLDLTTAAPVALEEPATVSSDTTTTTDTVSDDSTSLGATGSTGSDTSDAATPALTPTPEPTSAALLALGGGALLGWRRRRRA